MGLLRIRFSDFYTTILIVALSVALPYSLRAENRPNGDVSPLRALEKPTQSTPTLKAETPATPTTVKDNAHCHRPKKQPGHALFQQLRQVALNVSLPSNYQIAIECHGREEECLDKNGAITDFPNKRAQLRAQLIKDYAALPAQLRPDSLRQRFKEMLDIQLMPFVEPDQACNIPDLVFLDEKSQSRLDKVADTLTIDVSLYIFDNMTPRLAVLTTHFYRLNAQHSNLSRQTFIPLTIVPLDISDDRIASLLTDYVKRVREWMPITTAATGQGRQFD